jgi:hypothetical protein
MLTRIAEDLVQDGQIWDDLVVIIGPDIDRALAAAQ